MFDSTIMTDVAHSIQSDRIKEAEQARLLNAIRTTSKASLAKNFWRISLPKAFTSKVYNLLHPTHASSTC